ncbi:hypothetical protein phiGrn1_0200 [Vibrio phage phi-Grn1]|uniref:Uncharacterized protein n=1 Tax=Vibrio phage phi-Grn1 TaxID=1747713 RepID=A0A126HH98_9CAUD|nr:hypothetical protein phiGrn1_0200 [Vibrio phage phi-Grn1]
MQVGDPNVFIKKLQEEFLPALQKKLEEDPKNRGGKIVYVGSSKTDTIQGLDVQISDKNGVVSTFYLNPFTQTFAPVFYS